MPLAQAQLPGPLTGAPAVDSGLGFAVAAVGDVNGDGFADFAVAGPYADRSAGGTLLRESGLTAIVFGGAAGLPPVHPLGTLSPDVGFLIEGASAHDTASPARS
ncbi:MAG: integrin alpha, partial [Pseudomonadota bacterium]